MTRTILQSPNAPSSPLYSQAVKVGTMLYLSGTTGFDTSTGQMAGTTIQEQTRQAIRNCESILSAGGATLGEVVTVMVLLARPEDFGGMNEEYAKFFPTTPPARAVGRLGVELPNVLVSLVMTASVGA